MNNNYKKILPIIAIIAIVIIAAILWIPGNTTGQFIKTESGESNSIRLGYTPLIHSLPIYIAIDKNYFTEQGLIVEPVKFESPNQMIDALMQGKLDFVTIGGPSGIVAVADYKNPGKIKIFALSGGYKENPNAVILVQPDSPIKSIEELKGKKFGILGGTIQWRTIARAILAKHGLDMDKDLTVVELAPTQQVAALAAKQIDALLALDPMATVALDKNVGKIIVKSPLEDDISDPIYAGAGSVNSEFAKNNPKTTQKFILAITKAVGDIRTNQVEARTHLKNYTPLDDATIQKATMPSFLMCGEITNVDVALLQKFLDIFTTYKVVEGKINTRALLYCTN
ncbi:MAG: ABC transporter substrate-binding protein [archaeon]